METVSLLLRISVDSAESTSIERQRAELLKVFNPDNGYTVVAEHVERGVSGAKRDRAALQAWMDDARTGRADVLAAYHFDRVSRDGFRAVADLKDALEDSGARYQSIADGLDSSNPTFDLQIGFTASLAAAERKRISERVTARQQDDIFNRHLWTKPAPYGYTKTGDGRLKQNKTTAPHLRRMFKDFLAGESLRAIATSLNERGIPAPRGGKWGVSSVRHILSSPSSAAVLHHDGEIVRDDQGHIVFVADKPVIPFDQHRDAVARLSEQHKPRGRRPNAPRYPLSGMMRCTACGGSFVVQNRKGGRRASLRCSGRGAGACTDSRFIIADDLLAEVVGRVTRRLAAEEPLSDWLGAVAQRLGLIEVPPAAKEIAEARETKADIEARIAEMENAYYTGRAFRGSGGKQRYEQTHAALLQQVEELNAIIGKEQPVPDVGPLLDPAEYEEADWLALRSLMEATVESVAIAPDKTATITWREA